MRHTHRGGEKGEGNILTEPHSWTVPLPGLSEVTEGRVDCKRKLSLLSGVHQQAEADQDNQQVDISGLIPRFVHRVVYRLGLVSQKPVSAH